MWIKKKEKKKKSIQSWAPSTILASRWKERIPIQLQDLDKEKEKNIVFECWATDYNTHIVQNMSIKYAYYMFHIIKKYKKYV